MSVTRRSSASLAESKCFANSGMLGWFCSLPSHRGVETREVNWSGSQTTEPRIYDRSKEPLIDTLIIIGMHFFKNSLHILSGSGSNYDSKSSPQKVLKGAFSVKETLVITIYLNQLKLF
ncbi:hypothetical protein V6Z12_A05G183000 [Gossypium hirsutum]